MPKIWENEKVIYFESEGLQYMQFKKLLEYPEITHCYTLRNGNELDFPPVYKNENKYKQSLQKICNCLNKQNEINAYKDKNINQIGKEKYLNKLDKKQVIKPHQTHTNNVQIVNKVEQLEAVDGILTNRNGLILLTTSADCISLLFFDKSKKVIASVHSGWRGTLQGICQETVKSMMQNYGSNPQEIICCICPSIRKCHFEVEDDVEKLFHQKYDKLENVIQKTQIKEGKQKYVIDTVEINKVLLKQIGLKEENIIDSEICTVCNSDKFHSYRVHKELSGRNAALICLN